MTENPQTNVIISKPSMNLRFVIRDGKRILQQAWVWESPDAKTGAQEWRDVPLGEE